ncbi:MAG: hypothetical protein Q3988_03875 [Gemella sp.]|nr:hypothetical protein [Gemella sp.]
MKLEVKKIEVFQLFDEENRLIYETKIEEQMNDVVKATQENGKLTLPTYYAAYDLNGVDDVIVEGFSYGRNLIELQEKFADYCRVEYQQDLFDGYDYFKTVEQLSTLEDSEILEYLNFEIREITPESPKL